MTHNDSGAYKVMRITDNFLHTDGDALVWDRPNDKWKIITTHRGHQIITNIQFDKTEHKPDLFLYTDVEQGDDVNRTMEQNSIKIDPGRKWFVRQMCEMDRIGVKQFGMLPLYRFLQYWRKPLNPRKIDFSAYRYQRGTETVRFHYDGEEWPVFIRWPELGEPMPVDPSSPYRNRGKLTYDDDRLVKWIKKCCGKGLYVFSDFESIFESEEDEFCYLTDLLMFSG